MRHNSCIAASFMQVLRIVMPDYEERSRALCVVNHPMYSALWKDPAGKEGILAYLNAHPFMEGPFATVLNADVGDEQLLMCGRVNDYGTNRTEKELDTCPWDIVGSEYCRCTTCFSQAMGDGYGGMPLEFNMVEARGCGDMHCRIVSENRDKYPMPEKKEPHHNFGPIATEDLIKYTPEDKLITEPEFFRPECDYLYKSGTNMQKTGAELFRVTANLALGTINVVPVLYSVDPELKTSTNVIKCIFETAGKMTFSEFAAIKGVRDWLGVPGDVNDGRVLGGFIEVILQSTLVPYSIVSFTGEEVILDINRLGLERQMPPLTLAYFSMWNGMAKTLISAEWAAWQVTEDVPEDILRLKIAKKTDKYC